MDVEVDPDKTNPFERGTVDTGGDDGDESFPMTSISSRRGSEDVTLPLHRRTHEQTSFITGIDENTPLIQRESKRDEAWDRIHEKFPEINPANSTFTATLDEYGRVKVKLKRSGGKSYPLFDGNGNVNEKLPKTITDNLGSTAEKVVEAKEEEISRRSAKVRELRSALETANENQRETINRQIDDMESEISDLEREKEEIERHMSLRNRIKAIFKKYGFTLIGVIAAVGTVIGVIISNLKNGLTTLGKGVGSGLKSIGNKLGEILPGLVGAIASFIFKTAGEVIGFLGKNAWLLILGVVVYFIEQLKKDHS